METLFRIDMLPNMTYRGHVTRSLQFIVGRFTDALQTIRPATHHIFAKALLGSNWLQKGTTFQIPHQRHIYLPATRSFGYSWCFITLNFTNITIENLYVPLVFFFFYTDVCRSLDSETIAARLKPPVKALCRYKSGVNERAVELQWKVVSNKC